MRLRPTRPLTLRTTSLPRPFSRRAACAAMAFAVCASSVMLASDLIPSPEPDWPQWRGARRDGISRETGLLPGWPAEGPPLLWKREGLGTGWSSPVIVGERGFITGDIDQQLVVFAFDLAGNLLWRATNGDAWTGSYPGARATCCYSEGRVYHLNAHGRLACFDARDGRELWHVNVLERFAGRNITWALSECLLVDQSRVLVTPGGDVALMAALDKYTGETVWCTPGQPEDQASYSSPLLLELDGRRVVTNCSSSHGFGVDALDGTLLWTVPLKNQFGVNTATPIFGAGAVFYVTPYGEEGRLYRLRSAGTQIVPDELWRCPLDTVTGSGVLVDGTLFASGYRRNKWWLGVDWQTGVTTSQQKSLTTGAAVYADGRLYCLDEKGSAALLSPAAAELQVAGQFQLAPERVTDAWAHPVLLHGRLYLRYHDTLWCYDVSAHNERHTTSDGQRTAHIEHPTSNDREDEPPAGELRPFWRSSTMYAESVLFVRDDDEHAPRGSLLFEPTRIVAVTNAARTVTYEEGRDFTWQAGSREMQLPVGSRIVWKTPQDLRRPPGSQPYALTHRDGQGEILFGAGHEYHDMQTVVTYTHAEVWPTPLPSLAEDTLPRTLRRLRAGHEPFKLALLGDSISTGCNASGWAHAAPFQPPYQDLLVQQLSAAYGGQITLDNFAVGGTDTAWGVANIGKVIDACPDLVILAFGMNDAAGRPPQEYQAHIRSMLAAVRERRPEAEFILVATMLGNRDWTLLHHDLFPQYRDALAGLCGDGVALADLTTIWSEMLHRKQNWDLTGNGVNHPNDFGHRIYAQVLSALLIP